MTPVTHPDVEAAALEAYLASELGWTVVDMTVLHDGLNLSIAIATADDERAGVLRRPNELRGTALFNGVKQEFDVMRGLAETTVPVPNPKLYCDDASLVGDDFLIMEYVDGAGIEWDEDLPEQFQTPDDRERVAHLLVDTLADLHTVDTGPFEETCDRVTPREVVAADLDRIDRAARVTGHDVSRLREVGERLLADAPADSDDPALALCHGDYKPDNVFFAGDDGPQLAAVADWETTTLGDPRTDLGYLLFFWREGDDPRVPLDALDVDLPAGERESLERRSERGFWPFTSAPGTPSRQDLVERYEFRTGRIYEDDRYYRAHAAFVLGAVWEDLTRLRVQQGDAEPGSGAHVEYVALLAQRILAGKVSL